MEDGHRIVLSLPQAALPVWSIKDPHTFLWQSRGSFFDSKITPLLHQLNIIKMITTFIYFYHCFQKQQQLPSGAIQEQSMHNNYPEESAIYNS